MIQFGTIVVSLSFGLYPWAVWFGARRKCLKSLLRKKIRNCLQGNFWPLFGTYRIGKPQREKNDEEQVIQCSAVGGTKKNSGIYDQMSGSYVLKWESILQKMVSTFMEISVTWSLSKKLSDSVFATFVLTPWCFTKRGPKSVHFNLIFYCYQGITKRISWAIACMQLNHR